LRVSVNGGDAWLATRRLVQNEFLEKTVKDRVGVGGEAGVHRAGLHDRAGRGGQPVPPLTEIEF